MKFRREAFLALVALAGSATAFPRHGQEGSGNRLEAHRGRDRNETMPKNVFGGIPEESRKEEDPEESAQGRPPRFGFPSHVHDVQGGGNVYPGLYGPVKLDIGGLLLGTIVGLGAFFILPKLFHVAANPYPGYRRSEDSAAAAAAAVKAGMETSAEKMLIRFFCATRYCNPKNEGATNGLPSSEVLMGKIQEVVNGFNVDSSACLQRTICSSVRSAGEKVENRSANGLESFLDAIARSDLFKALLRGSADWKRAVEAAERREDCGSVFQRCPEEVVNVVSAVSNYLMAS